MRNNVGRTYFVYMSRRLASCLISALARKQLNDLRNVNGIFLALSNRYFSFPRVNILPELIM